MLSHFHKGVFGLINKGRWSCCAVARPWAMAGRSALGCWPRTVSAHGWKGPRFTAHYAALPVGPSVRTRTKICGVTSVDDAGVAAAAGCDAVGLVFHPGSPRCVGLDQARAIAEALPPFVARVGVFVDPAPAAVAAVLEHLRLDALQFHGDEPAAACARFGVPYIKALPVRDALDMAAWEAAHPAAQGFLLDAFHPLVRGGGGCAFDWSLWPRAHTKPLILAGGLTPANVAGAIRRLRPHAVDVSSGVEGRQKGVKSAPRVRAFLREVGRAGGE